MRVLLTVQMDTDKANKAIKDQKLAAILQSVVEPLNAEAVYFGTKDGMRTGFIVFELQEMTRIPTIAEPLFQELGAKIEFTPVMNFDDVHAGLQAYTSG
ncbi:hypothetical protein LK07_17685 [Streptomyces pluripotens]|uniref:DUF3303 domain-containing protein n=1 Tax=Streptomyces pluripotens TaxID=1355015 RepID=A0A221P086_9ACTN|nr:MULTISPECIES: DUF3303 family protein [Streptomyces]ARP71310.1 hypothetical protein LK06_016535 [Streptomyces pluripotens]ASN25562.1 hypothetical protein LK07_17685 [Streptomyces pluripotens]KIE24667.1 hypothetical protein LK08_23565 [Streptomyces sp. MUSC 125]MCH0560908.1 hypothetical protein [Streptomyces sp. MUM 16J]